MRFFIPITVSLLAMGARAEALRVDSDLLDDATLLVIKHTQASATLPAVLSAAEETAGATREKGGSVSPMGRQFGIGLQVGYPTALSLKYMLTGDQGIQGGVGIFGYQCGRNFGFCTYGFALHADYLWHAAVLASPPPFVLSFYIGGGAQLGFGGYAGPFYTPFGSYVAGAGYFSLAARVPFGLSMALTQIPIEIFLEVTPTLIIFPPLGFTFAPSLGFRFYF
jgi:hypothetical protein